MRGLLVRGHLVESQNKLSQGGSQHRRSVKVAIEDEGYELGISCCPYKGCSGARTSHSRLRSSFDSL